MPNYTQAGRGWNHATRPAGGGPSGRQRNGRRPQPALEIELNKTKRKKQNEGSKQKKWRNQTKQTNKQTNQQDTDSFKLDSNRIKERHSTRSFFILLSLLLLLAFGGRDGRVRMRACRSRLYLSVFVIVESRTPALSLSYFLSYSIYLSN